ncbi:helix-turn-helix domain-containing protein [Streptantibioticus cattleyicolor]|uniref:DNA-binding protein n=1 Tax=Streptantibioticus cattleyicolor (strain ATCC 35852 / DSM 46488 / JCM 4925 / NBRC 14057 / NRRL 8057) TaxID=1003195 RepID=G8WWB6_STREN|nr:helix-turn-helix transcriptional regulator [Streptantibioticus cattleyicolor]AEW93772.1 DNA-binding protein [Streptantibioticus cattleyicolor NRRL 8057 = DSM 46488]
MARTPRPLTPDRSARHLFGAEVRRHRELAAMSLERLAEVVKYSKSHLARIESAECMVPPDLPGSLDAAFGTDGSFGRLYGLARREIHPDQFRRRMEIEAQARLIQEYSGQIVPGLVQTEEYARALFRTHNPKAPAGEMEELVTARMSRQALLRADPPPDHSMILDEAVLRRSFGGPAVMREQLARLADLTLTPTSVVQVLPFEHGGHALMGGSMALLTMADGTQVAWEEGISTGTLLEDPGDVTARQRAYDLLRACALSPKNSAAFIRSVMEALPR